MFFSKKIHLAIYFTLFVTISQNIWSQEVRIVAGNWKPFSSPELESDGVVAELAHAAFIRGGHESSLNWYPWARVLKIVEHGAADVALGGYHSKERAEIYNYSEPVFSIGVGLIALKSLGIERYDDLRSLESYNIGVMRGSVYTREFDTANYLTKQILANQSIAVRMLFAKRIDIFAASINVFKHEVRSLENRMEQEIVVLKPLLQSKLIYLMFSKKIPNSLELVNSFNFGMASIRADGTFQKILEKHGF